MPGLCTSMLRAHEVHGALCSQFAACASVDPSCATPLRSFCASQQSRGGACAVRPGSAKRFPEPCWNFQQVVSTVPWSRKHEKTYFK
jgi:hypothetical protein